MDMSKDFDLFRKSQGVSGIAMHQILSLTPNVIETSDKHPVIMNVYDRLMKERIIVLNSDINTTVVSVVNAQLLYLESISDEDISMYIASPGGSVLDGLNLVDTMNYIKPDVRTITQSLAASMGLIIATSGTKGKRSAMKHSRFLLHQPMSGVQPGTQASDMQITMDEINKLKKELYDIVADTTGQSFAKIQKDADRDYWLKSDEALKYGLIDEIITRKK